VFRWWWGEKKVPGSSRPYTLPQWRGNTNEGSPRTQKGSRGARENYQQNGLVSAFYTEEKRKLSHSASVPQFMPGAAGKRFAGGSPSLKRDSWWRRAKKKKGFRFFGLGKFSPLGIRKRRANLQERKT